MDGMMTKSKKSEEYINNLDETFEILRRNSMKLNPKKCIFGVIFGRLLRYLVSFNGIEANLEKIKALSGMRSLRSLK